MTSPFANNFHLLKIVVSQSLLIAFGGTKVKALCSIYQICHLMLKRLVISLIPGRKYLAWSYTNEKPKQDEDVKQIMRRENLELSNALCLLGIRPSTFNSLLVKGKKLQAQKLMEVALLEKSEEKIEEDLKGCVLKQH